MAVLLQQLLFVLVCASVRTTAQVYQPPPNENRNHWTSLAKRDLQAASNIYKQIRYNTAKNLLFFLGDGMGFTSVTAGRILKGQVMHNQSGEESLLSFEKMPHTALLKVYNTDMQSPDSAGTATAYLGGVKAKSGTVGVDQHIQVRNCSTYSEANRVLSFLEEAADAGKSVGIVTTTRVTHASPAAAYAHLVWRDWEDDTDRNKEVDQSLWNRCPDIAQQLIEKSHKFRVIFGGGRLKFLPNNATTNDRSNSRMQNGTRSDGRNLITEWKQKNAGLRSAYIETRDELMNLSSTDTDSVLGLFATSHMRYDIDNQRSVTFKEPNITEMTMKALDILQRNPKGFALFVEGGRIDHGHHDTKAAKALHDLLAFDATIEAAMNRVNNNETLSIVTADHSHVFSIGGWAGRGNAVLGKVRFSYEKRWNSDGEALADDGLPFTSLSYGDGPSAPINKSRSDLTGVNTHDVNYRQSAITHLSDESHGSEDVPVYASGPGAHLLHTTHEQSYVGNVVKYALCIGDFGKSGDCLKESGGSGNACDVNDGCKVTSLFMLSFGGAIFMILVGILS